jgi:hypothetical protein
MPSRGIRDDGLPPAQVGGKLSDMARSRILTLLIHEAAKQGRGPWDIGKGGGIRPTTLNDWWKGRVPAALENLEKLAEELGYELELKPKRKG